MTLRILLLLTILGPASAARAQAVGPEPDSTASAFDAQRAAEYAEERRAMARAGGRVIRVGGELRLRLASGLPVTLTDTLAEGDHHHRFVYLGFHPAQGLHVVALTYYEGGTVLLFHDRTGEGVLVPGAPVFSPDGRRFLSTSMDLEAGYDPNRLELWRVDPASGLRCEAVIDGGDQWGPDSVAWVGPDTVRFTRAALAQRTLARRRSAERIVRARNGWVLASSHRRLTERCSRRARPASGGAPG